jgi:hypothetical protein
LSVSFIPSIELTHIPLGVALMEGQKGKIVNHPKKLFFCGNWGIFDKKVPSNFFFKVLIIPSLKLGILCRSVKYVVKNLDV